MARKNWQQVKEIFHEALRLDPALRDFFLDEACAGDIDVRIEVESLLISFTDAKSFLEEPLVGDVHAEPWQLRDGQKISHYRIVSPIASGGMGEVYLADDELLNRQVALKVLPQGLLRDQERLRRFQREANVVSALNHPNILTIFEFGTDCEMHFLASEFVKGETLRSRLEAGPLELADALDIAVQIASALKAAHETGVVHRDIKPENVMIRDDGYVKVLDFGLAKLTERTESESRAETKLLSRPGLILGTVTYMSPEQTRGTVAIDARSDFFSFGVVLYEMLTGRVPFVGDTKADVLAAIIQLAPPPVSTYKNSIPAEMDRIVAKCLEKDRGDRYQTAADLISELKLFSKRHESAASSREIAALRGDQATEMNGGRETRPVTSDGGSDGRKTFFAAAIAAVALVLAFGGLWYFNLPQARQIGSIAVMPFVNESGIADAEYLCDGMTETLISRLARLRNLNVKARSTVFFYKGKAPDPKTVGKELSVEALLLGRVVAHGDRLQLFLELVDASTGDHIWGEQYNRSQSDLVALQNEVALDVSNKLSSRLSGSDEQILTKSFTENAEAYQLYLKGRFHTLKNTRSDHFKAIPYFEKAIEMDPEYALAYVGLADANRGLALAGEMRPSEYFPKAKAAALKALEIDPRLAEGHAILGWITYWYDRDWAAAEDNCIKALELDPKSSDAHMSYAHVLSSTGRHEEAVSEAKRANELEPLHLRNIVLEASFLIHAGRNDDALAVVGRALELDPNYWFAHQFAASAYIEKGMFEMAEDHARKGRDQYDVSTRMSAYEGYAMAKNGKRDRARAELNRMLRLAAERYVPPYNIAILCNALDERDQMLDWLERGVEGRDPRMVFLNVDPKFHHFRNDPRFKELLRRLRLPQ